MPVGSVAAPRRVPDVAELVALGRAQGLDAVGVAPASPFTAARRDLEDRKAQGLHGGMAFTYRDPAKSTDPTIALPDARAIIVAARSYLRPHPAIAGTPVRDPDDGPMPDRPQRDGGAHQRPTATVARYAWTDHYRPLRAALKIVARALKAEGWRARVVADDNALVDRAAAQRAGLGWYGKNANLLLPGQGSWFVLGTVITDAPLVTESPEPVADGCGSCRRCLDGCPTGAIVAPGVVDARRCLAWLLQVEGAFPREHRVALGDRIYGCDDCQEVCPPNRRRSRRGHAPTPGGDQTGPDGSDVLVAQVDVLGMLAATDDELLARHGRWYVPRREARYLRRNALVVLGNVGDPADPAVVAALGRALTDDDPLVRGHAVWASRRLGRTDLLRALADDDPAVADELAAPVEVRP
jgi:epoxyqueuosine reductase